MVEMTGSPSFILGVSIISVFVIQLVLNVAMLWSLRVTGRERTQLSRELFGLVRKLEGLTASKREQMLKQYDKILSELSSRLPTTIAAQASQNIFETESRILARLAELEPALKGDEIGRKRMDELIRSMERLEQTLVHSTSETVTKILVENRNNLFSDVETKFDDINELKLN